MTGGAAPSSDPRRPGRAAMWVRKPCFWLGVLVFLLALGIRLAHVIEYTHSIRVDYFRFDQTDSHTFHQWARNIAEGDWLCRTQVHPYHKWTAAVAPENQWIEWYGGAAVYHQAPLYPYLVGALYALFGVDVVYVRLFQAVMGAFTALIVFLIARSYLGRNTGIAAGLLMALSGFHFYYDAFILRESLVTFLTAAFLLAAIQAFKRRHAGILALAAFILGLDVAAKPTALLLAPIYLAAVFLWIKESGFKRRLLRAAVFAAAFILPLAPFYARNAALGIPLLKISTRGPTAFINGNLRGQTGVGWNPPADEVRRILWDANYKLTGVVRETLRSYMDNPLAYAGLLWEKTRAFFNSYEIPNNTNYYMIRGISRTLQLGFVSYWFMASAALLGMILLLPRARDFWQLYLVAILLTLATIAFFIVARFRQPLLPFFAVFAGYALVWGLKKIRSRRFAAVLPAAAVFGLVLAWTDHDEQVYDTRLGLNTGVMLKLAAQGDFAGAEVYKGRLLAALEIEMDGRYYPEYQEKIDTIDQAFVEFRASSAIGPDDARRQLHKARGFLHLMDITKRIQFQEFGEYTREAAEAALKLNPEVRGAQKTLGICLVKQADKSVDPQEKIRLLSEALKCFRKELALNPAEPDCLKALGFCFHAFGFVDQAIQYYEKYLLAADHRDYEIESQIAWLMIAPPAEPDEKTIAEALFLAGEAYRHDPDDLRNCRNYSSALHLAGRIDEAVAVAKRMIALDPASEETYQEMITDFTGGVDDENKEGKAGPGK